MRAFTMFGYLAPDIPIMYYNLYLFIAVVEELLTITIKLGPGPSESLPELHRGVICLVDELQGTTIYQYIVYLLHFLIPVHLTLLAVLLLD